MIPCLESQTGLQILASTADQRALLGEAAFLRTHMPMSFVQYRASSRSVVWTEADLLTRLLHTDGLPRGNRIFLLYGAAGAGKSETLRWTQIRLAQESPERSSLAVRIPRTALDPVRIVDEILRNFGAAGLTTQLDRWDSLKQKPVALANQVVWGALGDLLTKDHDIIPLSYKLRPIVEANLRAGIQSMEDEQGPGRPLELLTREQLKEALQASALVSDLPYEAFLARMREEFDQAVLGDVRMAKSLRELSQMALAGSGMRPVLLIDDLVQSLNVYASDLLDYFLTLEEGDWDVVIGLTPASFEGSERTRELLQRINHLDTVDDRVTRLYLSDVTGDDSSFLNPESVERFLEPYIMEIKQAHGFTCDSTCPGNSVCSALQLGQSDHTRLAPFNPALLRRLFGKLPRGKGKPRYLLNTARELLETARSGMAGWLDGLRLITARNHYAEADSLQLKTFAEAYLSPQSAEPEEVLLPETLGLLITGQNEQRTVIMHPLRAHANSEKAAVHQQAATAPDDGSETDYEAVRDWLEGHAVNKELLKPLRLGAARWVKDFVDPTRLSGLESLKNAGVLRWCVQNDDTDVPITLEGVDLVPEIQVGRRVGLSSFDLLRYGEVVGRGKESMVEKLLGSPECYGLIIGAEAWRQQKLSQLQAELGMPLEEFAHCLAAIVLCLPEVDIAEGRFALPVLPPEGRGLLVGLSFGRREQQAAMTLWEDMFRVRDNLYRASHLQRLSSLNHDRSLAALMSVNPDAIDPGFKLGPIRLRDYIAMIRPRLVALSALNNHTGIRECFQQFQKILHLNSQLTSMAARGMLRRSHASLQKVVGLLPLPMRQQLPDLLLPPGDPFLSESELAELVRLAVEHQNEVPPLATYRLVSEVLVHLKSPEGAGVETLGTDLGAWVRIVSSWVGERAGEGPVDPGLDLRATLQWLTGALKTCLASGLVDSHTPLPGDSVRWTRRLRTLEVLLPPRSALRKRYGQELRVLKESEGVPNWILLEQTVAKVLQSWRSILMVAQLLPDQRRFEELQGFLDACASGEETAEAIHYWTRLLAPAVRALQISHVQDREIAGLLIAFSQGEDQLSLSNLSAPAIQELRLCLPQVYSRLRLTVG